MSDSIGNITVPALTSSGLSFPLVSDINYSTTRAFPTISHRFGELETKASQTFAAGMGPRKFLFRRQHISFSDRASLLTFFENIQGTQTFLYNTPNPDQTTTTYTVLFENQPLSIQGLVNACQSGITFVEVPDPATAPVWTVSSTCARFPSDALQTALESEVQQIVPLITIRVRDTTVPPIYLSDRRCTVASILYLPRVLGIGDPNSDVLVSQNINGASDSVSFTFNNADRVFTQLSNVCDLKYASVSLCLYHVNSGILLQLWKGFIQNYQTDGGPTFPVQCSDGLYQVNQLYPSRCISRSCYKTFNDGHLCPYATDGVSALFGSSPHIGASASIGATTITLSGLGTGTMPYGVGFTLAGNQYQLADTNPSDFTQSNGFPIVGGSVTAPILPALLTAATSGEAITLSPTCDYYFDSINGCQTHGMSKYFGGHPLIPQGVFISDDSTGYFGLFRNKVTCVSIVSDAAYGQPLPEIWCNDGGNPLNSFTANAIMMDWRDDSGYANSIGIIGAGPIGKYAIDDPSVSTAQGGKILVNADGFHYILAPQVDGYPCQGFKVNMSNWTLESNSNALGLRQVHGADPIVPATDSFGMGSGGGKDYLGRQIPATWDTQRAAAGTAFCEINIVKSTAIQPSTPDKHVMSIPLSQGLSGRIWDASGNPTWVNGLTNPFWIAINSYLRAIGLTPSATDDSTQIAAQYATFVNPVVGDGSGPAEIADLQVVPILGAPNATLPVMTSKGSAMPHAQLLSNPDGSYAFYYVAPAGDETYLTQAQAVADGYMTAGSTSAKETQFQFQGRIAEQKPFRDWLNEILACSLGYFTFEYGKLKLGIRENASDTEAFTLGNMLFQSLKLTPIDATFEHLVMDFADVAYQWQANTAEYSDKDHAAYYGRAGAPLTARMHSLGSPSISQCLRLATTRVREEVGGVNAGEWLAARNASFRTTVLALATEVGQVISITHPDVPGGVGNFRIQGWKLMKDWSIQIQAKSVTVSMYALDMGPKPPNVLPAKLPVLFYPQPQGQWAPYQIQASNLDAIWPNEYNFDLIQNSSALTDGTIAANIMIMGKLPVNQFISGCGAPNIASGNVLQSQLGGSIPGGQTLEIAVCAINAAGGCSPPSRVIVLPISSTTNTNQFTINEIVWPDATANGLVGYVLFAANRDDLICAQQTVTGLSTLPKSITFTGPVARSTWALPNPDISNVRIKSKLLVHGGVIGAPISSISGNTLVASNTIDAGTLPTGATRDNWNGRKLMIVGRNGESCPYQSFNISAFDPASGTFTLLDNAGAPADLSNVLVEDVFMVTFLGYDNSTNPLVFADAGINNAGNYSPASEHSSMHLSTPHSGLTVDQDKGNIMRVISGTSRGKLAKIVSNDATSWTIDQPLPLDASSIVVIEGPSWEETINASPTPNASPQTVANINVPIQNFQNTSMLVTAVTVSNEAVESPDGDGPVRLTFCYGAGGTRTLVTTSTVNAFTQLVTDGRLVCDTTLGSMTIQLVEDMAVYGQPLLIIKISPDSNTVTINAFAGTGGSGGDVFSNGTSSITLQACGASALLRF